VTRRRDLQLGAGVELVSARTALEGAESDTGATQRRDVAEVISADRSRLVIARHRLLGRHAICRTARRAVELICAPVACLVGASIDGEAFRSTRVELDANVRDLERFACQRRQGRKTIDRFVNIFVFDMIYACDTSRRKYTLCLKNRPPPYMRKFHIRLSETRSPHLNNVAALPCEKQLN